MKHLRILAALAATLALGRLHAAPVQTAASAPAPTVLVQSDRWMPLNGTPDEEPPGYAIELLIAVFTETHSLTYTLQPWTDSIENVTLGKAHAVIGAAKSEAPGLFFPKEAIARVDNGLWAKKGSTFTYSAANLAKAKVGVIKGYTYWTDLDALVKAGSPNLQVFAGDNAFNDALQALIRGDIDLLPESRAVFTWETRAQGLDSAAFELKYSQDGDLLYVAFTNSPKGRDLAAQWDACIAKLRKDGTLGQILAKYGVTDWVK